MYLSKTGSSISVPVLEILAPFSRGAGNLCSFPLSLLLLALLVPLDGFLSCCLLFCRPIPCRSKDVTTKCPHKFYLLVFLGLLQISLIGLWVAKQPKTIPTSTATSSQPPTIHPVKINLSISPPKKVLVIETTNRF